MSEDSYDYQIPLAAHKHRKPGAYADLLYKIVFHLLGKGSILPISQMAKELLMEVDALRNMLRTLRSENPQLHITLGIDFDAEEVVLQVTQVHYDSYTFEIPTPLEATLTYQAEVWPGVKNYEMT